MLDTKDIRLILSKIHPAFGYADDPHIRRLQIKLSIMLQAAADREGHRVVGQAQP